jgi:D-alanine-D-alanine ligase
MKILVLHSDVPDNAPPEDQDTLIAAREVSDALVSRGHRTALAAYKPDLDDLKRALAREAPAIVFNLVEGVFGSGLYSALAPAMLGRLGVPYTGGTAAHFLATTDKLFAKAVMAAADLPTPAWAEPPRWEGLDLDRRYIVKAADEDASVGLDDKAVVEGRAVPARAANCAVRFGGRWFAEAYVEGREFNLALMGEAGGLRVFPMAELRFVDWPMGKPSIVSYDAKWSEASHDWGHTARHFGVEREEPALAQALADLCRRTWKAFGLCGYARIDFRVGADGPTILEINPNPGIASDAGFAAAAAEAGLSYAEIIEKIAMAALG